MPDGREDVRHERARLAALNLSKGEIDRELPVGQGSDFSDCEAPIESIEAPTDFTRGAQICADRPLIRSGYLTHPAPDRTPISLALACAETVTADRATHTPPRAGCLISVRGTPDYQIVVCDAHCMT